MYSEYKYAKIRKNKRKATALSSSISFSNQTYENKFITLISCHFPNYLNSYKRKYRAVTKGVNINTYIYIISIIKSTFQYIVIFYNF